MKDVLEYRIQHPGRRYCNSIILIVPLIIFLSVSTAQITGAVEPLITVENAVWTNAVNGLQYQDVYTETAPIGSLFLWMNIHGRSEALKKLEEAGKLPIYHKWSRMTICGADKLGSQPLLNELSLIDTIPIPAGKNELLEELQNEISKNSYFNWRTWSMKENARSGKWIVEVVYADHSPVKCPGNTDCVYEITIE